MGEAPVIIEKAEPADLAPILALLADNGLPADGLADCLPSTLVARQADGFIGCVALEVYGQAALLRSLAVREAWRGRGLGQKLVDQALVMARGRQIVTIYLLTETAVPFFARHFTFVAINRAEVDLDVRASVEFTTACPDTAQAMMLRL
jgi:amino-acid N-acetyltransferase